MAAPQLVKKTITLTVESVNARGKIWVVNTKVDDKPFALKMFAGSYERHSGTVKAGATFEAEIENRGDDSKSDWFLCGPAGATGGFKGGGNRGGAPAKADPAKLKVMEDGNKIMDEASRRKDESIREANIRNSITAIAVAGVTAIGEEAKDANVLRAWVQDVHSFVEDMVREANGG